MTNIPSGYVKIAIENHHAIHGKIHYEWSFSIATLNYQRVAMENPQNKYGGFKRWENHLFRLGPSIPWLC
jgi:hypothetical protein